MASKVFQAVGSMRRSIVSCIGWKPSVMTLRALSSRSTQELDTGKVAGTESAVNRSNLFTFLRQALPEWEVKNVADFRSRVLPSLELSQFDKLASSAAESCEVGSTLILLEAMQERASAGAPIALSKETSSKIFKMLTSTRKLKYIAQLRAKIIVPQNGTSIMLNRLSEDEVGFCVNFSDRQDSAVESFRWARVMECWNDQLERLPSDDPRKLELQGKRLKLPAQAYNLVLRSLTTKLSWDRLFELLSDMRLNHVRPSKNQLERLICSCADVPLTRWQYIPRFLFDYVHWSDGTASATQETRSKPSNAVIAHALRGLLTSRRPELVLSTWNHMQEIVLSSDKAVETGARAVPEGPILSSHMVYYDLLDPIGNAAVLTNNLAALRQLLVGPEFSNVANLDDAITQSLKADNILWFQSSRLAVGLHYFLKRNMPSAAKEIFEHASNSYATRDKSRLEARYRVEAVPTFTQGSPGASSSDNSNAEDGEDRGRKPEKMFDNRHDAIDILCRQAFAPTSEKDVIDIARFMSDLVLSPRNDFENMSMNQSVGGNLIRMFGMISDIAAAKVVYKRCEEKGVLLTPKAMAIFSNMVLLQGEFKMVLDVLETYLRRWDEDQKRKRSSQNKRKVNRHSKPDPVDFLPAKVFSPALKALSELGELDMLIALLTKEMPQRGVKVQTPQIVLAITALKNAGEYERAVDLYFTVYGQYGNSKSDHTASSSPNSPSAEDEAMELTTENAKKSVDSRSNRRTNNASEKLPFSTAAVYAALDSCAGGRLGLQALTILLSVVDQFSHQNDNRPINLPEEMRLMNYVVTAMASEENIQMLPQFLTAMGSTGSLRRPILPTPRLLATCLSAAFTTMNKSVAFAVLDSFHRFSFPVDAEAIDTAVQLSVNSMMPRRGNGNRPIGQEDGAMDDISKHVDPHHSEIQAQGHRSSFRSRDKILEDEFRKKFRSFAEDVLSEWKSSADDELDKL